ncbi:MAG TPA: SDR family oxidoreductase [Thermoanaerobaculia bacterium]|nr:SDR family oxidoreductase [Thermoanaerobaculia bacterium]
MSGGPPLAAGPAELFDLRGEVALVTGAAGLLGEVWAEALAGAGADLVLTDLDGDAAARRAEGLVGAAGVRAIGCALDVTRPEDWERAIGEAGRAIGPPSVLVNNAGYTNRTPSAHFGAAFEAFPLEEWRAILDVNLTGTLLGCQAVGPGMVARGRGAIVNVASLYGLVSPQHPIYQGTGQRQPAAYSVSKAGVLALTRYLATLWAPDGVRVNAITPGGVRAGQDERFLERFAERCPAGRMAEREELRGAIVYLASPAASYVSGHNLVVDGGWTAW